MLSDALRFATVVVIDEVDTDNWGIGGEVVTQLRLAQAATR